MSAKTTLTTTIIAAVAEKCVSQPDADVVALDKALGLENPDIGTATTPEATADKLLSEWVRLNGGDAEAVRKLHGLLKDHGYTQAAAYVHGLLKDHVYPHSATEGGVASKASKHGHSHDAHAPPSTTDRIITLVTTIVVAALGIAYIRYTEF